VTRLTGLAAAAVIAVAGGCGEDEKKDRPEPRPGVPFELGVGKTTRIELKSNPSTGYRWLVVGSPEAVVVVRGRYAPDPSSEGSVGAGGTQSFTVRGVRPGEAQVRLDYVGPSRQVGSRRQYRFVVR
jgi:predicted secreted protein